MAEIINMPKLGFDMQEGQLINWLKKTGDAIKEGDVIAEIESDKATIEVEVFQTGTLLELLAKEGDWVPVGAPIAVVGQAGEAVDKAALGLAEQAAPQAAAEAPAASAQAPAAPAAPATPANGAPPAPTPNGTPAPSAAEAEAGDYPGGVKASPLARKVAEDMGIDLRQVSGSGPNGRIVRSDVEGMKDQLGDMPAVPSALAAPAHSAAPAPMPGITAGPDDQTIPASRIRQRIAARMTESKTSIPHFYVTSEIDMAPAVALRQQINERLEAQDVKVTINDMVIKAAALTLREFPNLNAVYNGSEIIRRGHINVGIAVAIEDGLLNVVSKDADKTPLATMSMSHRDMVARAREGKVKPEDVEGETFAVSNLGPYEVESFVAIINPPSAAIMAVGSAKQVPVVNAAGEIVVGVRMKATLSADHRVTDGAEAARFMKFFKDIMEDPMRLLL